MDNTQTCSQPARDHTCSEYSNNFGRTRALVNSQPLDPHTSTQTAQDRTQYHAHISCMNIQRAGERKRGREEERERGGEREIEREREMDDIKKVQFRRL